MLIILSNVVYAKAAKGEVVLRNFRNCSWEGELAFLELQLGLECLSFVLDNWVLLQFKKGCIDLL